MVALTLILGVIIGTSLYGGLSSTNSGQEKAFSDGYRQGVIDGAGRSYNLRDPSYQETLDFIKIDKTNEHPYVQDNYTYWQFSTDLINNALAAQYRAGFVYIALIGGAHAVVAFNTTDRGLVFIEPQDDQVVTLTIGTHYFDRSRFTVDYDDTIQSYQIIW